MKNAQQGLFSEAFELSKQECSEFEPCQLPLMAAGWSTFKAIMSQDSHQALQKKQLLQNVSNLTLS